MQKKEKKKNLIIRIKVEKFKVSLYHRSEYTLYHPYIYGDVVLILFLS